MKFNYKAITSDGVRIEDTADAQDKYALARTLKEKGYTLVSVEEADKGSITLEKIDIFLSRVKTQDKILFAKNLSAMVDAGLSLSRGLSIAERQTKNKKFKKVLGDIADTVETGGALNAGLAKHPNVFPQLFTAMVKAGEESGNLVQALLVVGEQMQKTHRLKKKIRGAMIYPAIIVAAMIVVGILMLIFVVPTLTATFKELDVDLPMATQAIIVVSDFLIAHTILILAALAAAVVGIVAFFRTPRGERIFAYVALRIPLIGTLIKKTNSARTARTLSSLLSSGVDVVEALSITHDVIQNPYYKEVIKKAESSIQKGTALSAEIKKADDLYPILVGEMIEVGEETGKLSHMLEEVASFYENDVEEATKNMSTVIEPFLMVVVGVVVGFFAIAMISPTYSLLNEI